MGIYCYDDATATSSLGFIITQDDIAGLAPTDTNQLIAAVNDGTCSAEFYLLSSGEYQLNIYAPEGKIYTLIDTDLNFRDASRTSFDPAE